jgi:iron(III) transport system permease protein
MTRWSAFHLASWTFEHWAAVYGEFSFWSSFRNTVTIGLGAAFLAIALLFLVAYVIVKTRCKGRRLLDLVSWLPWSFPGILLGFGLLSLTLRVPLFRPLYGSVALLILAIVAVNMTVGTQLLKNGLMQLSRELEEGSRAAGASWSATQLRIVLPLLAPILVTIGLVIFISAVRDVSTVLLLAAPGTRTLALLSLDYIVTGRLEEAAVITSLVIVLAIGTALIARSFGSRMGLDRRY